MGDQPIKGACHCGAVAFEVEPRDRFLVACNCSICRRLATLWLHSPPAKARIVRGADQTLAYLWGDRELAFHTCRTCGCTTHWASATGNGRMAVNMRLADPADIADIQVRQFDGADSWEFLD